VPEVGLQITAQDLFEQARARVRREIDHAEKRSRT
jgi:hypothetical protein